MARGARLTTRPPPRARHGRRGPGARQLRTVLLEGRLRRAQARINDHLPPEMLDEVVRVVTRLDSPSLKERNHAFPKLVATAPRPRGQPHSRRGAVRPLAHHRRRGAGPDALPRLRDLSTGFWDEARDAADSDPLVDVWTGFATDLAMNLPGVARVPVVDPYVDDVVNGDIEVLDGDVDDAVDELVVRFESEADLALDAERTVDFWADVRSAVTSAVEAEGSFRPGDERVAIEMLMHASAAHRVAF